MPLLLVREGALFFSNLTCEVILDMARALKHGVDQDHNSTTSKDKYRVQLDFSGRNLAELEQLKEMIGASSRAELIRDALRWLYWCTEEVTLGATIIFENGEKQREVMFPFVRRKRAPSEQVGAAD